MRLFRPHLSNILRISIQKIRAHVTFEVIEAMLEMEQDDWGLYGRMRSQWEKKYEDANDILLRAEEVKAERRTEAERSQTEEGRMSGKYFMLEIAACFHITGGMPPASGPPAAESGKHMAQR